MILSLLRSKRKLWLICKYSVVLLLLFFAAVKLREKHLDKPTQFALNRQPEPVINNAGLEKFKEIQDKIIQEYIDPPKKEVEEPEEEKEEEEESLV